ncbi:helix-turn-helix domain-containing protein [Sphingomonas japonica]|uniref:DNA-binding CsgD family transcriptional regulator n=1 Tax=Sphingomonas japonica TaxID=511662 RepID=A0ABX0U495_9SPHN|nr:helix-turn-helix transcriptional regulator [Sphingomonas japonica]NIJ24206.1 DNA-binding CsgD family transcriptional regulator [Sphingomonas japonica]
MPGPKLPSERQQQCLSLSAQGLTSKEIGRRLSISHHTVESHITAAKIALGSRSRSEATAIMASLKTTSGSPAIAETDGPTTPICPDVGGDLPINPGGRASEVRETLARFDLGHPVPVGQTLPGVGRLSLGKKLLIALATAVIAPLIVTGIIVVGREAYFSPIDGLPPGKNKGAATQVADGDANGREDQEPYRE